VSHVYRYKVDVEVFDGDEVAKFVFWDNTLEDLLGMTASTLLAKQCQVTIRILFNRFNITLPDAYILSSTHFFHQIMIYLFVQIGCPDAVDYPDDLDDIMGRKFAFRVKWQPGWGGQGSVVHCKDSPELVSKIQEHLPVAEV
jgi:hypothetical protein